MRVRRLRWSGTESLWLRGLRVQAVVGSCALIAISYDPARDRVAPVMMTSHVS
jgi:hypothetical protein